MSLTLEPKSLTRAEVEVCHQAAAQASAVDQFTSIERHDDSGLDKVKKQNLMIYANTDVDLMNILVKINL